MYFEESVSAWWGRYQELGLRKVGAHEHEDMRKHKLIMMVYTCKKFEDTGLKS